MSDTNEDLFEEDIELKDQPEDSENDEDQGEPQEGDDQENEGEENDSEEEEFDADHAREKIRKVNSEARNLRKRVKELQRQLDERGEKGDDDAVEALRKENDRLRADLSLAAKKRIAAEHGLPESFADRLQGDDEDDWVEDAEELAAALKVSAPKKRTIRTTNPGAGRAEAKPKLSEADEFFGF